MNIVKGFHPSILHKHYSHFGKTYFCVSLLWGFELDSGKPVLEQKLWTIIADILGKNEMFDAGMPKPNAEFLLHGSFFSPGGRPVPGGTVSVSIGPLRKELAVFGERHWIRKLAMNVAISDPIPMTEMALTYRNAFGGEGFARNPVGKGFKPVSTPSGDIHSLPNIEHPKHLIGSSGDRPEPVSFSPLDLTWPQRRGKAGTYDDRYIRERMPGLPDDIDWHFFNEAPPDQWLSGYFQGNEPYELVNMHPHIRVLKGNLPGVYGRCFVNQKHEGRTDFREIRTRLDTVWFFPGVNLGVVVHRGSLDVYEDDAADIAQLLIAHENISDEPRSVDHYQHEMTLRTDPAKAALAVMNTVPLIPQGYRCGFKVLLEENSVESDSLTSENMKAFTDQKIAEVMQQLEEQKSEAVRQMEAAGIDASALSSLMPDSKPEKSAEEIAINALLEKALPGVTGPAGAIDYSQMDLSQFDELKKYLDNLAEEKQKQAFDQLREKIDQLKTEKNQPPDIEQTLAKLEQALAAQKQVPVLPRIDPDGLLEQVRQQFVEAEKQLLVLASMGVSADELPSVAIFDFDEQGPKIKKALEEAQNGYRLGAHAFGQARSPHQGREADIAADLVRTHAQGGKTAGGDYAFTDLSGLDLSGIDLSGAFLEHVNLSQTKLCGANLTKAVLAYADLNGADLSGARLVEANVGSALLTGTRFIEADLSNAILSKARLDKTLFHRCLLTGNPDMFLETVFNNTDFSGSRMTRSIFIDADISDCIFRETDLSESSFINPIMERTVFDQAIMEKVNIISARASNASFQQGRFDNIRFVGGCTLIGVDFRGASATMANFRDCDLHEANFSDAVLNLADFAGSQLIGAKFNRATAIRAQFNKADLAKASMVRANLMEASLFKAKLTEVNFAGANLYAANLMGSVLGHNDFSDSNLDQTILAKWRP